MFYNGFADPTSSATRPSSAVLLTPLECPFPSLILTSIQSAPGNPLESALTSHSQTVENTATLSLLECALTRLSPATPLESALTKNRAGGGSLFWFRSSPLTMCRSPQYSSSFFSHSCALFCSLLHAAKNQVLSFQSIPHSFSKIPHVHALRYSAHHALLRRCRVQS